MSNRTALRHSQTGIDHLRGGYIVELSSNANRDTTTLREKLEGLLGDEFVRLETRFKLPLSFKRPNSKSIQSLTEEFIEVAKTFRTNQPVHILVIGSLSAIREAALEELPKLKPKVRARLEDYYRSFGVKRVGRDDNKFPVNALNPFSRQRTFKRRQKRIIRDLDTRLARHTKAITSLLSQEFPGVIVTVRPIVLQLEVPQDNYFETPKKNEPWLQFERAAFSSRLIHDQLMSQGAGSVSGYPRALTEFDFAKSPITSMPYRHDKQRLVGLRTSEGYNVSTVTNWLKDSVVASVYWRQPSNAKKSIFPELIALHWYSFLLMPNGERSDLLRIEPRFLNRMGMKSESLMDLIGRLLSDAKKVLPPKEDLGLISTQRPLIVHRLLYSACKAIGLTDREYRVLCKGGGIKPGRRNLRLDGFEMFFVQRKRRK